MAAPIPPPRKNSKSRCRSRGSSISDLSHEESRPQSSSKRFELIHQVEVHNSKSKLLSSSDEEGIPQAFLQGPKKRRKRFRKKQSTVRNTSEIFTCGPSSVGDAPGSSDDSRKTVVLSQATNGKPAKKRGSLTETLSEDSDRKICLPIVTAASSERKKPSGSATETLSEDSSPSRRPVNVQNDVVEELMECQKKDKETKSNIPVPVPRKRALKGVQSSPNIISSQPTVRLMCCDAYRSKNVEFAVEVDTTSRPTSGHQIKQEKEEDSKSLNKSESQLIERNDNIPDDEGLICITVHGCDPTTRVYKFGRRPFVRIHIVDAGTVGTTTDLNEAIVVHVITTPPCYDSSVGDFRVQWEAEALICERLSNILRPDFVLFFEIIDSETEDCKSWAFLKPVGANGELNVGRVVRLQLFKTPKTKKKKDATLPPCYYWWLKRNLRAYKSTLYLSVRSVPDCGTAEEHLTTNSSMNQLENDKLQDSTNNNSTKQSKKENETGCELIPVKWSRYPTQLCKFPNKKLFSLDAGPDGSLVLEFSHSGLLLACPTRAAIVLYTFQGRVYHVFLGHEGLIYSVKWSKDDKYLMTASADSTVCLWNVEAKNPSPVKILPHPSYVYSCCWLGCGDSVATGCFDGAVRVWKLDSPLEPNQFLSIHKSRVNCVVEVDGTSGGRVAARMVSADADGIIAIWSERNDGLFALDRELKLNELNGKIINKLYPHPNGKRILVHTRDSLLRMLDVQTGAIIQWYQGGVNRKFRMDSTLCGCGSKVFACSEDGTLCIWETDTGNQLGAYHLKSGRGMAVPPPPAAVAFHPHDHVLAVVSHANDLYPGLVVLGYDRNEDGKNVGLVLIDSDLAEKSTPPRVENVEEKLWPGMKPHEIHRSGKHKEDSSFLGHLLGKKKRSYDQHKGKLNKGITEEVSLEGSVSKSINENIIETSVNKTNSCGVSTDTRLADIIYQMDTILSRVSPKPNY